MALTMLDKKAAAEERSAWPAEIKAEFERENRQHNGCVGTELLSETDKVRVWIIRLQPGERVGFHRHVLNYFWTSVNGGRGRQHLMDGTTVEHTLLSRRDAARDLWAGRVQSARPGKSRRQGDDLQHHRVPGQRQQAAAGAGPRPVVSHLTHPAMARRGIRRADGFLRVRLLAAADGLAKPRRILHTAAHTACNNVKNRP